MRLFQVSISTSQISLALRLKCSLAIKASCAAAKKLILRRWPRSCACSFARGACRPAWMRRKRFGRIAPSSAPERGDGKSEIRRPKSQLAVLGFGLWISFDLRISVSDFSFWQRLILCLRQKTKHHQSSEKQQAEQ